MVERKLEVESKDLVGVKAVLRVIECSASATVYGTGLPTNPLS